MQHKAMYFLFCKLPPTNVAQLAWSRRREVAAQKYDQNRRL